MYVFLLSLPDECHLQIRVRDTDSFPRKSSFKVAALDEVVVSFWQFLAHCVQQLERAKRGLEASAPASEEQRQVLQTREATLKEHLAIAETLQRNVPFTILGGGRQRR